MVFAAVGREQNVVAHDLARFARTGQCMVNLAPPPDFIVDALCKDCATPQSIKLSPLLSQKKKGTTETSPYRLV